MEKQKYKQTEIGEIPEDWDTLPLGKIAIIDGGYAFSSVKFTTSGDFQIIKMSNLYNGKLDLNRSSSFLNKLSVNPPKHKTPKLPFLII